MTSWFLALFLLATTAWQAWRIFRTTDSPRKLIYGAVSHVVVVFLLAHAITLQWGAVVPIWLWWASAALLAVHTGGLADRLLSGVRAPRSPAAPVPAAAQTPPR